MNKALYFLGLRILPAAVNLYIKTLRIQILSEPDLNNNFVFTFWHSQMLLGWWLFKDKSFAALVSKSKDGEILNNLLKKWNYIVVRGSSSEGGKEALQEIVSLVRQNNSVVLTPDGPRGPLHDIKNGALIISNECGIPIVPVKIVYHNKIHLRNSWDKFQIPLPFTKCVVHFGSKFHYENFLKDDDLKRFKEKLSKQMS